MNQLTEIRPSTHSLQRSEAAKEDSMGKLDNTEDLAFTKRSVSDNKVSLKEGFIEYGISIEGKDPRRGTWQPNYDDAIAVASFYDKQTPGLKIVVLERDMEIHTSKWRDAKMPDEIESIDGYGIPEFHNL